jgi:hypothetical protein
MHDFYLSRLYLQDSHLTETNPFGEHNDIIVTSWEALDTSNLPAKFGKSTHKVILNKTIFHPQGIPLCLFAPVHFMELFSFIRRRTTK